MNEGRITRIIGPVIDVRFPSGELPPVLGALLIKSRQGDRIMEVHAHLDQTTVRGIIMSSTVGLTRNTPVIDTGEQISVPVGNGSRGRMFDALGQPIDGAGELKDVEMVSIHRPPPPFPEQDPSIRSWASSIPSLNVLPWSMR